ncbi:hypothetical protein bthur0013_15950 [Bacillus thuringiensis IBL 200]|nr:hypothetical protein bthur0013_15950 [Bacillus thuringiensis IBL 200]
MVTEEIKLHLFFNNDQFETAEVSDILRLTPPGVFQAAYGVSAEKLGKDFSSIKESVVIGPPNSNRLKDVKESDDSNIVVTINGQITSCEIE